MKSNPPLRLLALLFVAALFAGGAASTLHAQGVENYTYTVALFAGVGGGLDADPDPGIGESTYMIQAGMFTEPRTLVSVRAGKLQLRGDEGFEDFTSADLEYVNIAGEYRFRQSYYDFGLYIGAGYYRLSGDLRTGGNEGESDVGLALGLTGDFDITTHFSVVVDIAGHYAFLDQAAIYGMGQIGLAYHW